MSKSHAFRNSLLFCGLGGIGPRQRNQFAHVGVDVVTRKGHTSAAVIDYPAIRRLRMVGVETVELCNGGVEGRESFLEPDLDERLRKFGCKPREQQEFAAILVFPELLEQRVDELTPSGRGDRVDLLGRLAV